MVDRLTSQNSESFIDTVTKGLYFSWSGTTAEFRSGVAAADGDKNFSKQVLDHFQRNPPVHWRFC